MWTCGKCQETHEDQFDTCWRCGAAVADAQAGADPKDGEESAHVAKDVNGADEESTKSGSLPSQGNPRRTPLGEVAWCLLTIAQVISMIWCVLAPIRGINELKQLAKANQVIRVWAPDNQKSDVALLVICTRGAEFFLSAAMVVVFSRVKRWPVDEQRK